VGLFVVRAQEPGITFATGGLNLKVDSEATYNGFPWPSGTWGLKNLKPGIDKFWNFDDIKPGDKGENTISLHVDKDAWICLEFLNLKDFENNENEPESLEDTEAGGELSENIEFFAWRDDGDNIFEVGEKPIFGTTTQKAVQVLNNQVYPIADYKHGPAIPKYQTKYFGIYWCAGDLTVDVPTAALICDGEAMGNNSQTDSMTVDVQLFAVAKYDKPKFTCDKIVVPPPGEQCEVGSVTIKVDNTTTIFSTTTSSSNTGGNTVGSGGTIITGDATSTSNTTNIINTTIITTGGTTTTTTDATSIINSLQNLLRRR
jgi:hypothetical protein